jgi:hypothetical protein
MGLLRFLFGDIGQHARDNIEDSLEDGERMLTSIRSGNLTFHSDGHTTMKCGNMFFDL